MLLQLAVASVAPQLLRCGRTLAAHSLHSPTSPVAVQPRSRSRSRSPKPPRPKRSPPPRRSSRSLSSRRPEVGGFQINGRKRRRRRRRRVDSRIPFWGRAVTCNIMQPALEVTARMWPSLSACWAFRAVWLHLRICQSGNSTAAPPCSFHGPKAAHSAGEPKSDGASHFSPRTCQTPSCERRNHPFLRGRPILPRQSSSFPACAASHWRTGWNFMLFGNHISRIDVKEEF